MFGLDPVLTKITCDGFFRMIHPDDRVDLVREFEGAVQVEREFDAEYRIVRPDGSTRYIHGHGQALCVAFGETTQYAGTVADITDQKQQERRSFESMTAGFAPGSSAATMEQLMAVVAHEVNQPLTAVITNAGAALHWLAGVRPRPDRIRRVLLQIAADGNRASEVIARIRVLSGRAEVGRHPLSLNAVIEVVIASTSPAMRSHGVVLRTRLEKCLPPVQGDRIQMQQVVLNLVMNAIEAMTAVDTRSRSLLIETVSDVEGVSVCVDDSGPGVDERMLEKVFEPFVTTKVHGMGIGLAITRSIVEGHGGRLWAERKPTQGAKFTFRVPFAEARTR